jgi:hypothetical protein
MVTLDWIYSSKKSTKRSHKTMFSARVTPNSVPKKSTHSRDRSIVDLPSDVIVTALSFLKPIEVDKNLIRVSKVLRYSLPSCARISCSVVSFMITHNIFNDFLATKRSRKHFGKASVGGLASTRKNTIMSLSLVPTSIISKCRACQTTFRPSKPHCDSSILKNAE